MSSLGELHWEAMQWLMTYIKGTAQLCITYTKGKDFFLVQGLCDS